MYGLNVWVKRIKLIDTGKICIDFSKQSVKKYALSYIYPIYGTGVFTPQSQLFDKISQYDC